MKGNVARQWINVLALAGTIVVNALANALPLNGRTTGEISDQFKVYFVPAGYVFSIWGVIYLALAGFAVYQALPAQRANPRLERIGYYFALSCLANTAWIFLWHYGIYDWTIVAMLSLLFALIAIYLRLGIGRHRVTAAEKSFLQFPFSIYLGWITVATIANAAALLDYQRWNGWGIRPEVWTVIMLAAATGIASAVSLTRGDVAYTLVVAWAFAGIAVRHAGTPLVPVSSWVATGVVAAVLLLGVLVHARRWPATATKG